MAKDKRTPAEATRLFEATIKASVKGDPKSKKQTMTDNFLDNKKLINIFLEVPGSTFDFNGVEATQINIEISPPNKPQEPIIKYSLHLQGVSLKGFTKDNFRLKCLNHLFGGDENQIKEEVKTLSRDDKYNGIISDYLISVLMK